VGRREREEGHSRAAVLHTSSGGAVFGRSKEGALGRGFRQSPEALPRHAGKRCGAAPSHPGSCFCICWRSSATFRPDCRGGHEAHGGGCVRECVPQTIVPQHPTQPERPSLPPSCNLAQTHAFHHQSAHPPLPSHPPVLHVLPRQLVLRHGTHSQQLHPSSQSAIHKFYKRLRGRQAGAGRGWQGSGWQGRQLQGRLKMAGQAGQPRLGFHKHGSAFAPVKARTHRPNQ
jgi:hypothetical protein